MSLTVLPAGQESNQLAGREASSMKPTVLHPGSCRDLHWALHEVVTTVTTYPHQNTHCGNNAISGPHYLYGLQLSCAVSN